MFVGLEATNLWVLYYIPQKTCIYPNQIDTKIIIRNISLFNLHLFELHSLLPCPYLSKFLCTFLDPEFLLLDSFKSLYF